MPYYRIPVELAICAADEVAAIKAVKDFLSKNKEIGELVQATMAPNALKRVEIPQFDPDKIFTYPTT